MQIIVISAWNQYKVLLMRYFTFFFVLNLQNPVCILHLQYISVRTSHIQVLRNHIWLVATKWYSSALALWRGYFLYLDHPASINFLINFMWGYKALLRTQQPSFICLLLNQNLNTTSFNPVTATVMGCLSSMFRSCSALLLGRIDPILRSTCVVTYCMGGGWEALTEEWGILACHPSLLVSLLILVKRLFLCLLRIKIDF